MKQNNINYKKDQSENVTTDILSDFLKEAAQTMLKIAIEAEANQFIESYKDKLLANGYQQIVRNGYLPEREIKTGIGAVKVKVPRIRDRADGDISFTSSLVPKYMRRTATIDVLLPLLYLKGISTNDFVSSLEPIFGNTAKNLSPSFISRLKDGWYDEYLSWSKRDLSNKQYVYLWVDGVYITARTESDKSCMLVIIVADKDGHKELVSVEDGFRESKESWKEVLLDIKARGLIDFPKLAIGDGALGFWGAANEIYPDMKHQRCCVHKTANILNKLPKSMHEKAKRMIHDIYMSPTRKDANIAWSKFLSNYSAKYPKAIECLLKSEIELLAFYDFPAEHWIHIRTTNPIESTFATVKHRTRKSRNCFSRKTIVASLFKLLCEAELRWKPLRGKQRIAQIIRLEKFIDGICENDINATILGKQENAA